MKESLEASRTILIVAKNFMIRAGEQVSKLFSSLIRCRQLHTQKQRFCTRFIRKLLDFDLPIRALV